MFLRSKKSGRHEYLQLVHNTRVEGRVRQQVLGTLAAWIACTKADSSTP